MVDYIVITCSRRTTRAFENNTRYHFTLDELTPFMGGMYWTYLAIYPDTVSLHMCVMSTDGFPLAELWQDKHTNFPRGAPNP